MYVSRKMFDTAFVAKNPVTVPRITAGMRSIIVYRINTVKIVYDLLKYRLNIAKITFSSGVNTASQEYPVCGSIDRCPKCGVAMNEYGVCPKCGYRT